MPDDHGSEALLVQFLTDKPLKSGRPLEHPTDPQQANASASLARDPQLRRELQATLAARKDLGADYEQELIDAFLHRLEQTIAARTPTRPPEPRPDRKLLSEPTRRLAILLALAIPLLGIAGDAAGGVGILGVLALVGFLAVYFERRHP